MDNQKVYKFLTSDGYVRASAIKATESVVEMQRRLSSGPLATVSGGRALVGCALMVSHMKEKASVGLHFKGDGPLESVFAECSYEGKVRVYISNPQATLPLKEGKLDVGGGIGIGLLEVVRGAKYSKNPHRATVIIKTGEIAEDLVFYYQQSFQIPSLMALSVDILDNGLVKSAGGVFLELLPGYDKSVIERIESRFKSARPLSNLLEEGASEKQMVEEYLRDFEISSLGESTHLQYSCRCSIKRIKDTLGLIGLAELDDIISKNKPIDIRCELCGLSYNIDIDTIKKVRQKTYKNSLN